MGDRTPKDDPQTALAGNDHGQAPRRINTHEGGAAAKVAVLLLLLVVLGLYGAFYAFGRIMEDKLEDVATVVTKASHDSQHGAGGRGLTRSIDDDEARSGQQALSGHAGELGLLTSGRPHPAAGPPDPMALPPGLQRDVAMVNWLIADADMTHVEGEAVDLRIAATELVDALQEAGADDPTRLAVARRALVTTMRVGDGSGLLVRSGNGYFVATNAHVVANIGEGAMATFASPYQAPRQGKVVYMGASVDDVAAYDDRVRLADDLAFIEVAPDQLSAEERSGAWSVSEFRDPRDSERVALVGYPFVHGMKDGTWPKRLAVTQSYVDPNFVKLRTLADGTEEEAQILQQQVGVEAKTLIGGNSGGPAFAVSQSGFRPVGLVTYSDLPAHLKADGKDANAVRSQVYLAEGDSVRTHFDRISEKGQSDAQ